MNSLKKNKYVSTKNSMFHVNLPPQEYEERGVDIPEEEEVVQPDLFPGEVVIAAANNVLKFSPGSEQNTGISGTLFITNLRLTLHTTLPPTQKEEQLYHHSLSHLFLGPHDIELCLVSSVCLLDEHNQRRKQLSLENVLPDRVPGIQLILKNFRVVNLSFKFSPSGEESKVVKALLHHTSPASVDLLFLSPGRPPPPAHIPSFRNYHDWQCELERTGCPNWRITQHNENFNLCATFPPVLVVPSSLVDKDVEQAAHHFRESRPLVWLWGAPGGAALVAMAHISPGIGDTVSLSPRGFGKFKMSKLEEEAKSMENFLVKAIHRSHPHRGDGPTILDLDAELPQPHELQQAASRLRALHLPDGGVSSSGAYLSRFESSRWMGFVSKTLQVATRAAQLITDHNLSVILQEGSGRDSACVVSTLVEVLCDPYARTIRGLHSALAKHWVALGHPFTARLGHTRHNKQEQGPCFLLLLDCLQQVCVQQPHLLEYSPQYLAALWSAAHCPLYTTCLFDSTNARQSTISVLQRESRSSNIELWDVWNWWASCISQAPTHHETSSTNTRTSITSSTNTRTSITSTTIGKKTWDRKKSNGESPIEGDDGMLIKVSVRSENDDQRSNSSPSPPPKDQQEEDPSRTGTGNVCQAADGDQDDGRPGCSCPQTARSPCRKPFCRGGGGSSRGACSASCSIARRSFLSPLYVHQLFLSLLSPGAVDRIRDPVSIAHHTWEQIRRLLFPARTQHLPYDTSSPPIFPQLAATSQREDDLRPPSKSQLPSPLQLDPSVPRLEPWVGLFGQWLPEEGYSVTGAQDTTNRKLSLPQNPHLLFWDIIYEMYDTVDTYLNQPQACSSSSGGAASLAAIRESLVVNGLKV